MQFSWIYDNAQSRQLYRSQQYLRLSLAEAGGLSDVMAGWWGTHKNQGERQLWNQRFSQFVKVTGEFRNTYQLKPGHSIVTRVLAGVGYAYGNSTEMPYSERFYIGGANSLRGFAARSVGPGSEAIKAMEHFLHEQGIDLGNIRLFCVGDIKLETNLEYRFPLAGNLNGAIFADVGNIWAFERTGQEEVEDPDADDFDKEVEMIIVKGSPYLDSNPLKQLAVDVGAGLRYDLGMLVVRFDIGVPLHDPNDNAYGHYFNCRQGFFRNLGYNLAIGYPF